MATLRGICLPVDHVANEALEGFILNELLINVRVVLQQCLHDVIQGLIVRHSWGVRCVLFSVLVGDVGCNFWGNIDLLAHHHADPVVGSDFFDDCGYDLVETPTLGIVSRCDKIGALVGDKFLGAGFFP